MKRWSISRKGVLNPWCSGFHEMRAARGRQQMSSAFSRVLRFRMSGRLLANAPVGCRRWIPLER